MDQELAKEGGALNVLGFMCVKRPFLKGTYYVIFQPFFFITLLLLYKPPYIKLITYELINNDPMVLHNYLPNNLQPPYQFIFMKIVIYFHLFLYYIFKFILPHHQSNIIVTMYQFS
jgi:hypothetical protein